MLLAIDIGNTQTVVGAFVDGTLYHHWRSATDSNVSADELAVLLDGLLRLDGMKIADIGKAVISSVVPSLTGAYRSMLADRCKLRPVIVDGSSYLGFEVAYEQPRDVGPDRLVNCLAVIKMYAVPAVIVDFGTATTFDVIDRKGAYAGGAIAPGLESSLAALVERAARLSSVDLVVPPSVIGANTADSLRSGMLHGTASMVDGMVEKISAVAEVKPVVIATGGLCDLVAPLCANVDKVDPWLTLTGLYHAHGILHRDAG